VSEDLLRREQERIEAERGHVEQVRAAAGVEVGEITRGARRGAGADRPTGSGLRRGRQCRTAATQSGRLGAADHRPGVGHSGHEDRALRRARLVGVPGL
jgi:hypothetical protein